MSEALKEAIRTRNGQIAYLQQKISRCKDAGVIAVHEKKIAILQEANRRDQERFDREFAPSEARRQSQIELIQRLVMGSQTTA